MLYNKTLEQKIQSNDRTLKRLSLELERMQKESDACLDTIGLTAEEINKLLDNKDSFSEEQRAECKKLLDGFEERLERDKGSDPRAKAKTYALLRRSRNWIQV